MKAVKFEDLKVGAAGELKQIITAEHVKKFIELSQDLNLIHKDEAYSKKTILRGNIVHGMLTMAFVSQLVGMIMPGPGSVWVEQNIRFLEPVRIGDTINIKSELLAKIPKRNHVLIRISCFNQAGELVLEGEGVHKILQ